MRPSTSLVATRMVAPSLAMLLLYHHHPPAAQADFYREQLVQEAAGAQAALESERVRLREAMETERTACATRVREVHSSSNTTL